MHAAQIAGIALYIMFGPPKMKLVPTPMEKCHHNVTNYTVN